MWLAHHERLHMEVVVKFIVAKEGDIDDARVRFEREAALLAQARSPHVVQIFDHGLTTDGVPYIAMEYLVGEDLASRIEREGRIAPDIFAEWFRQASLGLARAHSKGIVHRDLKPGNVFLCNEDGDVLVKLLDFGIAKGPDPRGMFGETMTGALLGTAHYMSPEQTMGSKKIDARSDLWAMGVLAYYALTGRHPFDGDGIGPIVVGITSHDPAPFTALVPSLPPALDDWLARALAKDPEQRFQSARDMANSFVEAATGREITRSEDFGIVPQRAFLAGLAQNHHTTLVPATSISTLNERPTRWPSARARAWSVGGALLLLAGLAGAFVWRSVKTATETEAVLARTGVSVAGPIDQETTGDETTATGVPIEGDTPIEHQRPASRPLDEVLAEQESKENGGGRTRVHRTKLEGSKTTSSPGAKGEGSGVGAGNGRKKPLNMSLQ